MSDTVLIVLIIAVVVIIVLWIFRKQVSHFFIKAGKEGVEADFTTREPASGAAAASNSRPGVTISGNKQIGKANKIDVAQSDVAVEDNLQLGEGQQIKVRPDPGAEPPKS